MTDLIKIVEEEQIKLTIYVPTLVLRQVFFFYIVLSMNACNVHLTFEIHYAEFQLVIFLFAPDLNSLHGQHTKVQKHCTNQCSMQSGNTMEASGEGKSGSVTGSEHSRI